MLSLVAASLIAAAPAAEDLPGWPRAKLVAEVERLEATRPALTPAFVLFGLGGGCIFTALGTLWSVGVVALHPRRAVGEGTKTRSSAPARSKIV